MKQIATIILIFISLTSYSQGSKYTVKGNGTGGSNVGDSVKKNTDTLGIYKGLIYPVVASNATKLSYTDTGTTVVTQTYQIQSFDTLGTTPTATYPAGVFTAGKVFLGVAYNQTEAVSLWNASSINQAIGTLKKGSSPFTFTMYPILTIRPTAIYLQPQVQIGTVFYDDFKRGYWGSNWDTASLASTATWTTLGGGGVKLYKLAATSDFTNIIKYIGKGSLTTRNFEIQIDWRPCTLGLSTYGPIIGTYSLRNPAQNCSANTYPDFSTNVGPNFTIGAANSSGVITAKTNSATGVPTRSTSNRYSLVMKVMADTISSYLINRNTNEILNLQYFYDFTNTSQTATKPNIFYPSFGEIGADSVIVYNFRYFNHDKRFIKILCVGNSITTGYYSGQAANGYPGQLKAKTNYDIQTLAGGYNRTADVIDNLTEIIDQHPEYVFLEIGTNDRGNSIAQATIHANIDTINNRLTRAGIKVYHIAAPDAGNPVTAATTNKYLKDTYGAFFIDTWTGCYAAGQMVDAVHPNAIGFKVIADTIQSKVPTLFPLNGKKIEGFIYNAASSALSLAAVTATDSTTTKKISITGFKTNNSGFAVGSMEWQPFALNNAFVTENLYYDIAAGFKYRATGYGHLMQYYSGQVILGGFNTHTAGTTAIGADFNTGFKTDYSGVTVIGGNITSTLNSYTGGTLVATSTGVSIGSAVAPTDKLEVTGNLSLKTAGNKIKITTGSNASIGVSGAMTAGTITISTTAVTASSKIFLTHATTGGTTGVLTVGTIVAGTSFVINSSNAADTGTVNWWIIN